MRVYHYVIRLLICGGGVVRVDGELVRLNYSDTREARNKHLAAQQSLITGNGKFEVPS